MDGSFLNSSQRRAATTPTLPGTALPPHREDPSRVTPMIPRTLTTPPPLTKVMHQQLGSDTYDLLCSCRSLNRRVKI